ncbi:HNH endonuclease [Nostoc sp. UHCC 0702]|nr:HNH endonuclease [Nostoc sp. UHCC 0702]
MQVLEQSVVVFSQNYLPLCQVNIKRAIMLLVKSKAKPLSFAMQDRWRVQSPGLLLDVPKHMRLKIASSERMWKIPPVNWQELSQQNHHSCQYCGSSKNFTLARVGRRVKAVPDTGDNVVTASERSNSHKGDRTPLKAGMQLRKTPKLLVRLAISFVVCEAWRNSATQFWIDVQANLE